MTTQQQPISVVSSNVPREELYSTIEKECLAIKLAIQHFRVYLLGRPFVIQTDHRSLEWLDRLEENNFRLSQWSLSLQPYQFQVQYCADRSNSNADALLSMTSLSLEKGEVPCCYFSPSYPSFVLDMLTVRQFENMEMCEREQKCEQK